MPHAGEADPKADRDLTTRPLGLKVHATARDARGALSIAPRERARSDCVHHLPPFAVSVTLKALSHAELSAHRVSERSVAIRRRCTHHARTGGGTIRRSEESVTPSFMNLRLMRLGLPHNQPWRQLLTKTNQP